MSKPRQRTLVAASVTAISAFGMLTATAPAHAAPVCEVYGFAGDVTIKGNGAIVELNFSANGTSAHGPATASGDKGGVMTGIIAGGSSRTVQDSTSRLLPTPGAAPLCSPARYAKAT